MKSLAKLGSVRIHSELVIPYSGRPLTKGSWWTEMLPNSRLPSPTKGIPDSTTARFDRIRELLIRLENTAQDTSGLSMSFITCWLTTNQ